MKQEDIDILEEDGWTIDCESPFEISREDDNSFARGAAAYYVLDFLHMDNVKEPKQYDSVAKLLADTIPEKDLRNWIEDLWNEQVELRTKLREARQSSAMKCSNCGGYSLALAEGASKCRCEFESENEK